LAGEIPIPPLGTTAAPTVAGRLQIAYVGFNFKVDNGIVQTTCHFFRVCCPGFKMWKIGKKKIRRDFFSARDVWPKRLQYERSES